MSGAKTSIEIYSKPQSVDYYARIEGISACERSAFDKCLHPGDAVLDVGVGGGRTTAYLAPKARHYVAVDYCEAMVVAARAKYPQLEFHCADACDLSFLADGSFDVVVFSYNGIDNIPSVAARLACLREVARVLKPRGHFVFSSHNAHMTGFWPVNSQYSEVPGSVSRKLKPPTSARLPTRLVRRLKLPAIRRRAELALRALTTKAFYLGHGYIVEAGLWTFTATPQYVSAELNQAGLQLIETLGCRYPDKVPDLLTHYYYYIAVKP